MNDHSARRLDDSVSTDTTHDCDMSVEHSSLPLARSARANTALRAKIDHFFLQHHAALVKFFAYRLHCIQEAKDVAQQTYVWLLTHQHDPRVLRWSDPIKPLVYRVAWNIAGNRLMNRKRHARLARKVVDTTTPLAPPPEQLCVAQEDLAIIEESLKMLPVRCRTVFTLARLDGLSFEEIAERMEMTVRSVYRDIDRALKYFLQQLGTTSDASARKRYVTEKDPKRRVVS
jgi:RNA polymerase sigma factor (sigma-70 family)